MTETTTSTADVTTPTMNTPTTRSVQGLCREERRSARQGLGSVRCALVHLERLGAETTPPNGTTARRATGATTIACAESGQRATGVKRVSWLSDASEKSVCTGSDDQEEQPLVPPSIKRRHLEAKRRVRLSTTERRYLDGLRGAWEVLREEMNKAEGWLWTKQATDRHDRFWDERCRRFKHGRLQLEMGAALLAKAVEGRDDFA